MQKDVLACADVEPPSLQTEVCQGELFPRDLTFALAQSQPASSVQSAIPAHRLSRLQPKNQSPRNGKGRCVADTNSFRRRFFPGVTLSEWNDWRWQVRNRIVGVEGLARFIFLSPEERAAVAGSKVTLPLSITPYYLSLLDPYDPLQPLRRCVIPTMAETVHSHGESLDPLDESGDSPVPGLVHRYPDRVLFLVTGFCSTYCRYCTRSRLVGNDHGGCSFSRKRLEEGIAYIAANPTIRDVLISGGDPLTLADDQLDWILGRIRSIKHVEFVRLGTKVPAVLPQRVTPSLTRVLKKYHPLFISVHFTHPDELTAETARACTRLADAGIPLGSQTVLLAGINDNVEVMKNLMQGLLKIRVRPYYLYQCDPIMGSAHFRTQVRKGIEIIQGLRGFTTGYAVPTFVIDAPGGGGKIPLQPDTVVGRDGIDLLIRNYEGKVYSYPEPSGKLM